MKKTKFKASFKKKKGHNKKHKKHSPSKETKDSKKHKNKSSKSKKHKNSDSIELNTHSSGTLYVKKSVFFQTANNGIIEYNYKENETIREACNFIKFRINAYRVFVYCRGHRVDELVPIKSLMQSKDEPLVAVIEHNRDIQVGTVKGCKKVDIDIEKIFGRSNSMGSIASQKSRFKLNELKDEEENETESDGESTSEEESDDESDGSSNSDENNANDNDDDNDDDDNDDDSNSSN